MSTVADKLTALASVKEAQRVALSLGTGVPFAEYVDNFPSGGATDPSILFAGGKIGMWLDPSDMSSMFQDSAGTIPVTAVGQPVGLMLDKSGNGFHASQSVLARRPELQLVDGLYRVKGDGVDDVLEFSEGVFGDESASIHIVFSMQSDMTGFVNLYAPRDSGFYMNFNASSSYSPRFSVSTSAGALQIFDNPPFLAGSRYLSSQSYDTSRGSMGVCRDASVYGFTKTTAGTKLAAMSIYGILGQAYGGYHFDGSFYGFIARRGVLAIEESEVVTGYLRLTGGIA